MSNKRYYWLKLQENFFEREEIKVIESQKNGVHYINFYLKLLLKTINSNGELFFRNTIPYTPEMLSSITNTDVDTVRVATELFIKLGLMEIWDDGTLFLHESQKMVGSETRQASIMRKKRAKNKEIKEEKVTLLQNVTKCYTEIEIDKDIEIDKEKNKDNSPTKVEPPSLENQFIDIWNSIDGVRKIRKMNEGRIRRLRARMKDYSEEEFLNALRAIPSSDFLMGKNDRGWIANVDFFLKPDTINKILEGDFNNAQQQAATKTNSYNKVLEDISRRREVLGNFDWEGDNERF